MTDGGAGRGERSTARCALVGLAVAVVLNVAVVLVPAMVTHHRYELSDTLLFFTAPTLVVGVVAGAGNAKVLNSLDRHGGRRGR